MDIPRTRRLMGATALVTIGVAAAGLTDATGARARPGHSIAGRTLHLVEKGGGLKFIDNPPKARHQFDFSPGDIVIVSRDLFAPNGRRVGSLRLACIATDATTQQCNGTEALTGGTLELAGTSVPKPRTAVAVIGGTGAYSGARGTSVSTDRKTNADVADQIITILP